MIEGGNRRPIPYFDPQNALKMRFLGKNPKILQKSIQFITQDRLEPILSGRFYQYRDDIIGMDHKKHSEIMFHVKHFTSLLPHNEQSFTKIPHKIWHFHIPNANLRPIHHRIRLFHVKHTIISEK